MQIASSFLRLETQSQAPMPKQIESFMLPNHLGQQSKHYLVGLQGLPCDVIHSMRRIRYFTSAGVSHEEVLLMASRQLIEEQGGRLFKFHTGLQLQNNPPGMQSPDGSLRAFMSTEDSFQTKLCIFPVLECCNSSSSSSSNIICPCHGCPQLDLQFWKILNYCMLS